MNIFFDYNKPIANIPGTSIHIYSVLMAIAILVVIFCSWLKMHRRNIPTKTLEGAILIIVPCGLLGARIWYVLNHTETIRSVIDIIAVWKGGIAIQGGVVTGLIVGFIIFYRASLKYQISMWVYLDCILPNILLGQAIGRWGNFFNQEVLGWDNGQPFKWLPTWINAHLHYPNDSVEIYRQPLFLYESICCLFGWVILNFVVLKVGFWFSKKPWKINPDKYKPLWTYKPIVKQDYYKPWILVRKLHSYRKWKQKCWNEVYYDFKPEKSLIKDSSIKYFSPIKINPNMNIFHKGLINQKNFFRKLTNKFHQDASLLNNSYNPNQYKLTYAGVSGASYFVFYGIIRVILEPFRDERDIMMIGLVKTSILVSILWIIFGIILIVFAQIIARKKFRKKGWLYERQY
ncbi:MAG: prolipoprotein diacylglyceryl transferase [Spiroplasma sp.]